MNQTEIFNRQLLRIHRDRSIISDNDLLFKDSANELLSRILMIKNFKIKNIFEFGSRNGILTKILKDSNLRSEIILALDISEILTDKNSYADYAIAIDTEDLDLVEKEIKERGIPKAELIISFLDMQWFNNPIKWLMGIKNNLLSEKGLFIANLFGRNSLASLRNYLFNLEKKYSLLHTPHIIPLPSLEQAINLLKRANFKHCIADYYEINLRSNSVFSLMKYLQKIGENNNLKIKSILNKQMLSECKISGNFETSFNIITLLGTDSLIAL